MGAEQGVSRRGPYAAAALREQPDLRRDLELAERGGFPSVAAFLASEDAELRIADWERERQTCSFHRGPISECGDDDRDWYPQRRICWPTAMLAVANRKYDELHKDRPWHDGAEALWSETYSPLTPWHYRDGVTLYLAETDVNPEDDFLSEREGPVFDDN